MKALNPRVLNALRELIHQLYPRVLNALRALIGPLRHPTTQHNKIKKECDDKKNYDYYSLTGSNLDYCALNALRRAALRGLCVMIGPLRHPTTQQN